MPARSCGDGALRVATAAPGCPRAQLGHIKLPVILSAEERSAKRIVLRRRRTPTPSRPSDRIREFQP
jgi:hypothetical protein